MNSENEKGREKLMGSEKGIENSEKTGEDLVRKREAGKEKWMITRSKRMMEEIG